MVTELVRNSGNVPSLGFAFIRILALWLLLGFGNGTRGLGYTSSIAASYGDTGLVCAIEASGEQVVLCWGSNSSATVQASSTGVALSEVTGGQGFLCGLRLDTRFPFCWRGNRSNENTVPALYAGTSYSTITAGENHVCAIRSAADGGNLDCWGEDSNGETRPPQGLPNLESIIAGRGYTCGIDQTSHHAICWGTTQFNLTSTPLLRFAMLSAGTNHVCGIHKDDKLVTCWGDNQMSQAHAPRNHTFAAVTTGLSHSCGIRDDTHEVLCWGEIKMVQSSFLPGTPFLSVTSAPNMTCGVREDNLLAVCWGSGMEYLPPLELFSPGICSSRQCAKGEFHINASVVGLPANVNNICLNSAERICSPCADACPLGMFVSSNCSSDGDRSCTRCELCQADSCKTSCSLAVASPEISSLRGHASSKSGNPVHIIAAAVAGGLVVAVVGALVICLLWRKKVKNSVWACGSRDKALDFGGPTPPGSNHGSVGGERNSHEVVRMQAFRLAELRDATNGFKELNELGRGSYGFVYKALLHDGRQVAVKRANAARRIHSNSRDFEAELEVLCKVHHAHLVNLLGYCEEMGERLLVYEFMPHGTLHDHLHGGLAQLNWHLRLKVVTQAARGIEYLHKDASPRIVHKDIKSSNILLDAAWVARVADFGLALPERERVSLPQTARPSELAYVDPLYLQSQQYTTKSDIYSFGVVLFEILCGRKAYEIDFNPPNIVEWATPYVKQGKALSILDRSLDMPKNVDPLLRVAEIAELCVRPAPEERPTMTEVAAWLELAGRSSSM